MSIRSDYVASHEYSFPSQGGADTLEAARQRGEIITHTPRYSRNGEPITAQAFYQAVNATYTIPPVTSAHDMRWSNFDGATMTRLEGGDHVEIRRTRLEWMRDNARPLLLTGALAYATLAVGITAIAVMCHKS